MATQPPGCSVPLPHFLLGSLPLPSSLPPPPTHTLITLQAALDLFPAVAITSLTPDTYPQFMAAADTRAKVTGCTVRSAGSGNADLFNRALKPGLRAVLSSTAPAENAGFRSRNCAPAPSPQLPPSFPPLSPRPLQVLLFTDRDEPPPVFRALRCASTIYLPPAVSLRWQLHSPCTKLLRCAARNHGSCGALAAARVNSAVTMAWFCITIYSTLQHVT